MARKLTKRELEELIRAQEAGDIPNVQPDSSMRFEGRPQYTPPERVSGTNLFGDLKKVGSSLLDFTPQSSKENILDYRDMLGKPLVPVGEYSLGKDLEVPRYENIALLSHEAGEAFIKMNNAYKKDRGKDIPIESAFRDPDHNKKVGGSPTSSHMKARALDISDPESKKWVKENGEKFGWFFKDYATNSNHFEYEG